MKSYRPNFSSTSATSHQCAYILPFARRRLSIRAHRAVYLQGRYLPKTVAARHMHTKASVHSERLDDKHTHEDKPIRDRACCFISLAAFDMPLSKSTCLLACCRQNHGMEEEESHYVHTAARFMKRMPVMASSDVKLSRFRPCSGDSSDEMTSRRKDGSVMLSGSQ